jgi:hypothetical protein
MSVQSDDRLPEKGQGDYQYLIPWDDESAHFMIRLVRRKGRIVERDRNAEEVRKNPGMALYRTKDDRGPIKAVDSKYQHSKTWEYPFGPGAMSRVAVKHYRAKGPVPVYDRWGGEHHIHVSVETPFTVAESREKEYEIREIMEEKASEKLRAEMERRAEEEV